MGLFLVGLGIHGIDSVPPKLKRLVRKPCKLYLEKFTSFMPSEFIEELSKLLNRPITIVDRSFLEDGQELLEEAKTQNVVLMCYGDPLIATTHMQLVLGALSRHIKVEVFHNSSILNIAFGGAGLQTYRFGRIVTITRGTAPPITPYMVLHSNLVSNLHTLLLLESSPDLGTMKPHEAFSLLRKAEDYMSLHIIDDSLFVVVVCGLWPNIRFIAGTLAQLERIKIPGEQHSLIIPARLHFIEQEAIKLVVGFRGKIPDNTSRVIPFWKKAIDNLLPELKHVISGFLEAAHSPATLSALNKAQSLLDDIDLLIKQGMLDIALVKIGYLQALLDDLTRSRAGLYA
jgi:diphthine synthase